MFTYFSSVSTRCVAKGIGSILLAEMSQHEFKSILRADERGRNELAFIAEMDARMAAPPLYVNGHYGCVRTNPSPCDPRQFVIEGMACFILRMEGERKGKWHGARYLTFATAQRNLDRIARKIERSERRAR